MNEANLAAFARNVRARLAGDSADGKGRDGAYVRRRWGEVLRAVYAAQRDVAAYVALCEETELSAQDCLAIATLVRPQEAAEALAWVDRGLELDKKHRGSMAGHDLARMKRELLVRLGRGDNALEEAWAGFRKHPSKYTYEELMRFVPEARRADWHAKAMDAAGAADLGSLIELWLETREIDRLVERLRAAKDAELEDLSHYTTEPAARRLAKSHSDVAAKIFRALGMRILKAKKSKYYDAALSNFEDARACYERAGLSAMWEGLVREVRAEHHRKSRFITGFEELVAGAGPSARPGFLERAKARWSSSQGS